MDTASASRHPRASLPAFRRSIHLWPTALALGAIMALGGQTRAQVNLWSALNDGLQGDRVTLLETLGDPAQAPRTALIVTEEKGLLRSTDGGRSWSPVSLPKVVDAAPPTIHVFAPAPADVGGLQAYAGTSHDPALLRTADAGASWKPVNLPEGVKRVDQLVVLASGRLILGSANLPFVTMISDDGGEHWDSFPLLNFGAGDPLAALVRNAEGTRVYLLSGPTLYGSADEGKTWEALLGPEKGGLPATAAILAPVAGSGTRVFALVSSVVEGLGKKVDLRTSDTGGTDWVAHDLPPGAEPVLLHAGLAGAEERLVLALSDGSIHGSPDGGSTWAATHQAGVDATGIRVDGADGAIWVGTRGAGVFRFGNQTLRSGANLLRMTGIMAAPAADGPVLALARVREVVRDRSGRTVVEPLYQPFQRNAGAPWGAVGPAMPLGDTVKGAPDLASSQLIYSGAYRSSDWGRNWSPFGDSPDREGPPSIAAVGPITGTERVLYALDVPYRQGTGGSNIVRSMDGGATWLRMAPTVSGILAMAAANDPVFHTVFAVTERGVILRSFDHEPFMEIAQIPASPPLRNVFSLVVSSRFLSDHTLMVSVEEQRPADRALTYISTDEGETWTLRRAGLAGTARPRALFLSPDFWLDRVVFVGGYRAPTDDPVVTVYRSDSAGSSWTSELTLPAGGELFDFSLSGTMQAGSLYAAAGDAGIWRRPMSDAPHPTPTVTATQFFPTNTPIPPGFTPSVTPRPSLTPSPSPTASSPIPSPSPTSLISATPSPTLLPGQTPPTVIPTVTLPPTPERTPSPGPAAVFLPSLRKATR